ncbi:hypothetical protein [Flavobacterium orientale]|uniref:Uncharacterized protein n=1 Tax=Flavobacterium orientale TaxID=1756020 RepID=A0A916Y1I8_9FLAO|nr:hypothetical protein [Flavobacterium orientale]GGD26403.1 hypothetical protein GCM10011343_15790 [Flavobacterium orientale]
MARRSRPLNTTRSEFWLRKLINEHSNLLNEYLLENKIISKKDIIEWLSPISNDDNAEYYDEEFLEKLKIDKNKLKIPLKEFWPSGGPRWDGIGKTNTNKYFLIEAKAHIEEAVDYGSGAKAIKSINLIEKSIEEAKNFYSNNQSAYWQKPFYQYANRLAHLYYLKELNELNAYVIFIYFCNAPDVVKPTSKEEWTGHIRTIEKVFALNGKCKNKVNFLIDTDKLK